MLERKNDRSLDELFSLIAVFIDRGTECESTVPMTRMLTHHSETVLVVMGYMDHRHEVGMI